MLSVTGSGMWFRYWMPYVLKKIEHPQHKHVWLPLNRKYKLLGMNSEKWLTYEEHADKAMCFDRDPTKFKEIWSVCSADMVSLYDDWPQSRTTYFSRLGALMHKAHTLREVESSISLE